MLYCGFIEPAAGVWGWVLRVAEVLECLETGQVKRLKLRCSGIPLQP